MLWFNKWLFFACDEDKSLSLHMSVESHRLSKDRCWVSIYIHWTWKVDTRDKSIPCEVIGIIEHNE